MRGANSECLPCEGAREEGATACPGCEAGKFGKKCPADRCTNCTVCPVGRYSTGGDTPSCKICPKGYYALDSNITEMYKCEMCPRGMYGAAMLAASLLNCTECGMGRYSDKLAATAMDTCKACKAGVCNVCTSCAPFLAASPAWCCEDLWKACPECFTKQQPAPPLFVSCNCFCMFL